MDVWLQQIELFVVRAAKVLRYATESLWKPITENAVPGDGAITPDAAIRVTALLIAESHGTAWH